MFSDEFKQLLSDYPDAISNHRKLSGLLRDIFPHETKETRLLINLHELGIHDDIANIDRISNQFVYRYKKRLENDYGVSDENAFWGVSTWCICYGKSILRKPCEVTGSFEDFTKSTVPLKSHTEEALTINTIPIPKENQAISGAPSTFRNYDDYFVNVSIEKEKDRVFIPCGIGASDYGYYICGLTESNRCTHGYGNIYALVYNYIIRNSKMTNKDKPHYLKNINTPFQIDYLKIFRLETIILQLIKNNYIKGSFVGVQYDGDPNELKYALEIINDYAALFCRIIGISSCPPLKLTNSNTPVNITFTGKKGIYIENNDKPCNAREIWYGQKINYRISENNLRDLEYLLSEISPYDSFKEGQLDALKSMLGAEGHSICIMPTGSGKSLIFYMASILQPIPVFVITPTEILIRDQIRNLQKIHRIDNISHLRLLSDNNFSRFRIRNNLLYLTPSTFQNRNLLVSFRHINENMQVSYVVLDEVHCLSNWGHDFRPEYLMLSKFLNTFLNRSTFLGFTATANYTVVEDVRKQLSIPQENIFSPIFYEKFNILYDFRSVNSTREMHEEVCDIVAGLIRKNERTIIFTKNDRISELLTKSIGYEADVLKNDSMEAYQLFADEKSKVLVASDELGIGVNLPNVNNIIHFGLPVSKNEYVQEIGRAGRANEKVTSYIVYLKGTVNNVPQYLLERNINMDNLTLHSPNNDSDYVAVYRKLCNNIASKKSLVSDLMALYNELCVNDKALWVKTFPTKFVDDVKRYLYMLFAIGFIDDWYAYSADENKGTVDIMIVVSTSNHHLYIAPGSTQMITRVKQRAIEYFDFLGNSREQISKIQQAEEIKEVINIYADWYYSRFLYNHREMFLDFFEFLENNTDCDSEKVTKDIKDHFTLPFIKIKSDELKYSNLSHKEIGNLVVQGIGRNSIANIERLNSNHYSYSLDSLLFLIKLRTDKHFDGSRLDRVMSRTDKKEYTEFLKTVAKVYPFCDIDTRFEILKGFEQRLPSYGVSFAELLNLVYAFGEKDLIFYGILAITLNQKYSSLTGRI